jgi:hypothetical protein
MKGALFVRKTDGARKKISIPLICNYEKTCNLAAQTARQPTPVWLILSESA